MLYIKIKISLLQIYIIHDPIWTYTTPVVLTPPVPCYSYIFVFILESDKKINEKQKEQFNFRILKYITLLNGRLFNKPGNIQEIRFNQHAAF